MHEAMPRFLVSLCECLRPGPISSVERSARPCPHPSVRARVILRWRHAPSTRCRSVRRRRARFAGGACGVELSHRTTLNSLRRRASKFSLVLLCSRVKRLRRRRLSFDLPRLQERTCTARNSMGEASRSLCAVTMGLLRRMRKAAASKGTRQVLARGVWGTTFAARSQPTAFLATALRPPIGRRKR